ncbi:MAG: hypothetical protein ABF876_19635 [Acetobacter aceti]
MGDIWDYDQLIRIRRATEKMANNAISVADYNAVVRQNEALRQEIMRLQQDVQYWKLETKKITENRDKFFDLGLAWENRCKSYERRNTNGTNRILELEREIAALKARKA